MLILVIYTFAHSRSSDVQLYIEVWLQCHLNVAIYYQDYSLYCGQ